MKLIGAHLAGANLFRAHLAGARATDATRWPDGFGWRAAGAVLVDKEGNPVPAGPGAAEGVAPTTLQPHRQAAIGDHLGAGSEAPDA